MTIYCSLSVDLTTLTTYSPPVLFISTENPGVTTYRAIQTPSPWGSTRLILYPSGSWSLTLIPRSSNLSSSRGGWGIGRPPTCHSSGLCLCHLSLGGVDNPQRAVLSKARSSCRIQDAEPGTTLRANSRDNRSGKGLPFLFHAFFFSFSPSQILLWSRIMYPCCQMSYRSK